MYKRPLTYSEAQQKFREYCYCCVAWRHCWTERWQMSHWRQRRVHRIGQTSTAHYLHQFN